MMSGNDAISKLKARKAYLDELLERNRAAQKVIPYAEQLREQTVWAIEVISTQPEEAQEIPAPDLHNLDQENRFIQGAFPMMPEYDLPTAGSAVAANTTTTSTVIYSFVGRVGDIPTENAQSYSRSCIEKYHQIQDKYARVEEIGTLLANIPSSLALRRLGEASDSMSKWKAGVASRTTAANDVRNLLHGLQGDVYSLAYGKKRTKRKTDKGWKGMSDRIAKGGVGSFEHSELLEHEQVRSSLLNRLASISKDREGGFLTDLDAIWVQTLDHIYAVLNLIK